MDTVPKDVLILFALEMDMYTLLQFCKSNSTINDLICANNIFWKNKIEKERPGLLEKIYSDLEPIKYKDLYKKLRGNKVYKYYSVPPIYIKGEFEDRDFKEIGIDRIGIFDGDKMESRKNWVISTNHPEYTFEDPIYVNDHQDAINIIKSELEFHILDIDHMDIYNRYNRYMEDLQNNNKVHVDEENIDVIFTIQPTTIY